MAHCRQVWKLCPFDQVVPQPSANQRVWACGNRAADRASSHSCHAEPWPICPRQTGGPPHLSLEQRPAQELPTICSMIAVVETDGVRGR